MKTTFTLVPTLNPHNPGFQMMHLQIFSLFFILISWFSPLMANPVNQNTIPVNFRLMDQKTFQKIVVGNTIVGMTRQSQSLYLLYFAQDGTCELWKQNNVYLGSWWSEKDELGRDFMRAHWPDYASTEKKSLFSPANPNYGSATSVWYYVDAQQTDTLIVATKDFRSPVLLIPGRAFPSL